MMIKTLWPTNVLYEERVPEANDSFLYNLIEIGEEYEEQFPQAHYPVVIRQGPETTYNILKDTRPEVQVFKNILKTRMIKLAQAEDFYEPENVTFEAISTLRKFGTNQYAKPHCHRSVDYVAVLYAHVKSGYRPANVYQTMAGNRLQLIDPNPMRNRLLNHNMIYDIGPKTGTLVIHPSSVFHTAELNLTDEPILAFVTNIKVKETVRVYEKL